LAACTVEDELPMSIVEAHQLVLLLKDAPGDTDPTCILQAYKEHPASTVFFILVRYATWTTVKKKGL
jgi:hypothetical protein